MIMTKQMQNILEEERKGIIKLVTNIKPGTLMAYQTWSGHPSGAIQFYFIIDFDATTKCYTISERYSKDTTCKEKFHKVYIRETDKGQLDDMIVGNFPRSQYYSSMAHYDFLRSNLHIATKTEEKVYRLKNLIEHVSIIGIRFWDIAEKIKKTLDLDDYGIVDMDETRTVVKEALCDFLEEFNDVKKELKLNKSIFDVTYVEKYLNEKK